MWMGQGYKTAESCPGQDLGQRKTDKKYETTFHSNPKAINPSRRKTLCITSHEHNRKRNFVYKRPNPYTLYNPLSI
jgi:hypothetical protein